MKNEHGFLLIESMVAILLTTVIWSALLFLLLPILTSWTQGKNRLNIQQTARITVNTMIQEIRYAQQIMLGNTHSLLVTKGTGETITFQLGTGMHANTLYMVIDKTKTVPAGGISANPITENIVTQLDFAAPEHEAIHINIEVSNGQTGETYSLHSAVYPLNVR